MVILLERYTCIHAVGTKGTWKPRQKKIDYIEIDRKYYLKTTREIKQIKNLRILLYVVTGSRVS